MLKSIIASGVFLIACSLPIRVLAASFSDIFVFGDSFVDDGNYYEVSKTETSDHLPYFPGPPYPSEPYFEGRFSNSWVWAELLGEKIAVNYNSDNNFAFGGAGTGRVHHAGSAFPSLLTQVDNYINTLEVSADPNALYIISAGPNDSLTTPNEIATSIGNLSEAIINLSQVGAKNFLVQYLPDFGSLPMNFHSSESTKDSLSLLSDTYNHNLALSLQNIELNYGLNIVSLEINNLFDEVIANPEQFGFTIFSKAGCLNLETLTVCDNPDEYVFWDFIHPSAASHRLIANFAATQINDEWGDNDDDNVENKNVPETAAPLEANNLPETDALLEAQNIPETSYPLSMLTCLGLIYVLKNRYKRKI